MDVLFTCSTVDAIMRSAGNGALETVNASFILLWAYSKSAIALLAVHAWRFGNAEKIQRGIMWTFSLRLVVCLIVNDDSRVGRLRKGDMWPQLSSLVTFLRVSSGRRAQHPKRRWRHGYRRFLCIAMPWLVRAAVIIYVLGALGIWQIGRTGQVASVSRIGIAQSVAGSSQGGKEECVCPTPEERCTTFSAQPLACHELQRAREFNREIMPTMLKATYREVRRAMTNYGLYGSAWHVGHACPDPDKRNTTQREDHGWNLMAQHPADNVPLGHCLVSCAETKYMEALHVQCTTSSRCISDCSALLDDLESRR